MSGLVESPTAGNLRGELGYVVRAMRVLLADPAAGVERVRGRIDRQRDARAFHAAGSPIDTLYPIDPEWLRHLHAAMGWPWPCQAVADGELLRAEVLSTFAAKGLPERYQNWCDGGPAFTKAAHCLTVHLKPSTVVETGVARGVTSRLILEALTHEPAGRLYSVDLPALDSRYHDQIAIAVPGRMRTDWTIRSGTSRRELPQLLEELGAVDLFVHDSLHTGRNTLFELEHAWRVLRPGGAVLADDVYQSLAFSHFVRAAQPQFSIIGANDDGSYRFGLAVKAPASAPN